MMDAVRGWSQGFTLWVCVQRVEASRSGLNLSPVSPPKEHITPAHQFLNTILSGNLFYLLHQ